MDHIRRKYTRLYYQFADIILRSKVFPVPDYMKNHKNLFLYFDYEREFGGHQTNISDENIYSILEILDHYKIKTTWFTVGKIFESYPETIREIASRGHELGSHTYEHLSLLNSSLKRISKDFNSFHRVSQSVNHITGFHSPNGKWSLSILRELARRGFYYDLISCNGKLAGKVLILNVTQGKELVRFCSAGDDWPLFGKEISKEDAFEHFKKLFLKVRAGDLYGIGFHPWVLFSDLHILEGFKLFLEYITLQKDVIVYKAVDYSCEPLKKYTPGK